MILTKHYVYSTLEESKKEKSFSDIMRLLQEYPSSFFPGSFEETVLSDIGTSEILVAKDGDKIVGCLFHNPQTHECNWLAISKGIKNKLEIARTMFDTVFRSVPPGTKVFWYVNTEDAVYENKPVGKAFQPARVLYASMNLACTRIENKFGEGNHAYRFEKVV